MVDDDWDFLTSLRASLSTHLNKVLPGFARDDAVAIKGGGVRQQVVWQTEDLADLVRRVEFHRDQYGVCAIGHGSFLSNVL